MKKALFILLLLVFYLQGSASHIVGGEFELRYISGNNYRLSLIWYFDELNNPGRIPQFQEPSITVSIFRKSDNVLIRTQTLFFDEITDVHYTNDECSQGEIITDKLVYSSIVLLSPEVFNDPEGYYVAWERCCRNYQIDNIFSNDPQVSNQWAGQTFYMEFPPVVRNGVPFINNSPRLFPPLNDFACPYIPYYVDFAGIDDDGDSLVYSMVTPLNTHLPDALPVTQSAPYPTVQWRPGFGLDNIIRGVTNLEISTDGFLTVTPWTTGLFAFAVKCEEFRDGVKIGEIVRDFQMLVDAIGSCPDAQNPPKPSIVGKGPSDIDFGTSNHLTVSFANTVPIGERCFEVKISDPSASSPAEGNQEVIKVKAVPLDFKKKNLSKELLTDSIEVIMNGDEAFFQICFTKEGCLYKPGGTFNIGIVALDDACALPLTDTLYVTVTIEPPDNDKPLFSNDDGLTEFTTTLQEGDPLVSWDLQVTDPDNDQINYRLVPVGFTLADVGMTFTPLPTGTQLGPINKTLTWDPKCDVYDFTQKTNFLLYFIVEDVDLCKVKHADTTYFDLTIDLPGNFDPVIDNSILTNADTLRIDAKVYGDPVVIDVTGTDLDVDDAIVLRGSGIGFNPSDVGATFPKQIGNGSIESVFQWQLNNCDFAETVLGTDYAFNLMVVDSTNKCRFYKADTLHLIVHVDPPDNAAPDLEIFSENLDQQIIGDTLTAYVGSPINLTLIGSDTDVSPKDVLAISLEDMTEGVTADGYVFTPMQAVGPLETSFTWTFDCSTLLNEEYDDTYLFKFKLADDRCLSFANDSIMVYINLKQVDGGDDEFLPPNVFTPNGDGKNDFFAMVKLKEGTDDEFESILPNNNCEGEFVRVSIYDRWGKQVYKSSNRDFRWDGDDLSVGVYYYYLLYTNKSYKGIVSIRY